MRPTRGVPKAFSHGYDFRDHAVLFDDVGADFGVEFGWFTFDGDRGAIGLDVFRLGQLGFDDFDVGFSERLECAFLDVVFLPAVQAPV